MLVGVVVVVAVGFFLSNKIMKCVLNLSILPLVHTSIELISIRSVFITLNATVYILYYLCLCVKHYNNNNNSNGKNGLCVLLNFITLIRLYNDYNYNSILLHTENGCMVEMDGGFIIVIAYCSVGIN